MAKRLPDVVGATLVLALTLVGCTGGNTDTPETQVSPSSSPSPTPTDTPTPATPELKASARLVEYLSVRDAALREMRFAGRRFDGLASGQEFLALQQRIFEYSSNGFSLSGEYTHSVEETRQRDDSTVLVDVCEDESGVKLRTRDGKPVKRSLGGAQIPSSSTVTYTLSLTKGKWLVTASTYVLRKNGQVQAC